MLALQCIFPRSILTNGNCALVRFSAQTAAGLVKVDVNDFLVPRRSGLEEIAPLPRGESLVRTWRSRRSRLTRLRRRSRLRLLRRLRRRTPKSAKTTPKNCEKTRRKLDFSLRKWPRFGAQKTGPTSFTNSIGGHRFGAQIPGTEPGPQISPFFALFGGPGRVF